jgi:hypothetical protein
LLTFGKALLGGTMSLSRATQLAQFEEKPCLVESLLLFTA